MGADPRSWAIGTRFTLHAAERRLLDGATPVSLGGRAMELLCALAEVAPQVATKRHLFGRVWPGIVVEENTLAAQVAALRRVLGAAAIVTVSGRGYRLAATQCSTVVDPKDLRDTGGSIRGSLVERQPTLDALADAAASLPSRPGKVVVVFGEAGIGKSAVLNEWIRTLAGVRVVKSGCEALFTPRPLGPVYDVAPLLGGRVSELLRRPESRGELLAEVLARLAPAPFVWILEDLHWADSASLDLVKSVARRMASLRGLLVLSYRDDEASALTSLAVLLGDLPRSTLRLPLKPLSESAVAELAREAGRRPAAIYERTRGNPFFVTELLESQGTPATVRDAVLGRIALHGPDIRGGLEMLASLPGGADVKLLVALSESDPSWIDEAAASGLVELVGERVQFRHELAREVVYDACAPMRRRGLHLRILGTLEASADARALAAHLTHHAVAAQDQERVRRYAPLAAVDAAHRGAHGQAASHYATALRTLSEAEEAQRAAWLDAQADELYLAGNPPSAIALREAARAAWRKLGNVREEGRAVRKLARQYWSRGDGTGAVQAADEALAILATHTGDAEYGWALSTRAQLFMLASRYERAIELSTHAARLAMEHDDQGLLAHALNNIGTARSSLGDLPMGLLDLRRSLDLSRSHRLDDHIARALVNLISCQVIRFRLLDAEEAFDEASRFFAQHDLDNYRDYVLAMRLWSDFEQGRWLDLEDRLGQLVQSPFPLPRLHALVVASRLAVFRGADDWERLIADAAAIAQPTTEPQRIVPVLLARMEAAWVRGLVVATEDLQWLTAAVRDGKARELHDEIAFWLWRSGAESPVRPAQGSPQALQIAGRWEEAAAQWRARGCRLRAACVLVDGDRVAVSACRALLTSWGARLPEHWPERG